MNVADGLIEYMSENTGHVEVQLRDAPDADLAVVAMEAARKALFGIPHPEEPDDPLPSTVGEVRTGERGPTIDFDIHDAEVYDGLLETVVLTLKAAIEAAGGDGTLSWPEAS